ncbi:MAG: fibronectin type III domain-containing protein [Ruminococcus sp.]|nr:fibronectin type III domain-containing protein [Ruminococcus sp.]
MSTNFKRIVTLACAATISLSSLCMTTEALGGETLTSAASSAVSSIVSLDASFTSKKVTLKSDYTCTTSAVRLNWNKVSGASGYRIYKYDSSAKKWVKVKTVKGGSTTTARITGLSAGSKYRFKVKAYKHYNGKTYWSKASTQKYIATKPKQVTMKASTCTSNAIRLNWKKVKCDGYKIYQKVNGKYKLIATVRDSDTTTYRVSGLSSGTKYSFKVRAYRKDTAGKVVYGKCGVKVKTTKKATWTALDKAYYRICTGDCTDIAPKNNDYELVSEDICNHIISKYGEKYGIRRNTDLWRIFAYDSISNGTLDQLGCYNFNKSKIVLRSEITEEDAYDDAHQNIGIIPFGVSCDSGYSTDAYNDVQSFKEECYETFEAAIPSLKKTYGDYFEPNFCINIAFEISYSKSGKYSGCCIWFCDDASVGSHNVGDEFCASYESN